MSVPGSGSKIPEDLLNQLWAMSREINPTTSRRWSDQDLAGWLREAHQIQVSHDAVTRALRPLRAVARAAALESIRDRVARDLETQIGDLDDIAEMIALDACAATPAARRELFEAYTKFVALKLRHTLGDRVEVDADVTSGGAPLTFYVPKKRDPDDGDTG